MVAARDTVWYGVSERYGTVWCQREIRYGMVSARDTVRYCASERYGTVFLPNDRYFKIDTVQYFCREPVFSKRYGTVFLPRTGIFKKDTVRYGQTTGNKKNHSGH